MYGTCSRRGSDGGSPLSNEFADQRSGGDAVRRDGCGQAWTHAVGTYLAAIAPARRSEAEIVGIHLWTALHGQLVLWHTLPGRHTSSEDILIELEQSLLHRLLPQPRRTVRVRRRLQGRSDHRAP